MPQYVLTFHGEMGEMAQEGAEFDAMMAAWGQWYGSMGEALVDGGAPFSQQVGIAPDGGDTDVSATKMTGYTVIKTPDLAAAKAFAQTCPVLQSGNSIQISECIDMGG